MKKKSVVTVTIIHEQTNKTKKNLSDDDDEVCCTPLIKLKKNKSVNDLIYIFFFKFSNVLTYTHTLKSLTRT